MRVVLRLLGIEVLDLDLSDSIDPDPDRDLSGGTLSSTAIGFHQEVIEDDE